MNRANLGHTDLHVSPIGLGTVQLGMPYGYNNQPPPPDDEAIQLIRHAIDLGINYIDTAPTYGHSEFLVGRACADLPHPPIIATKLSIRNTQDGQLLTAQPLRDTIEQSLHNSLRLLGLEVLDLVQLHSLETHFSTPELLHILSDCKDRGLVRFWGVTTYGEEAPLDALNYPEHFSSLQIPYSVLDRRMETKVLPRAKEQQTGVVLRSIFLQGILSHRLHALPCHLLPLQTIAAPIAQLALEAGIELGELALRFAAFSPYVHSAIFGTANITELTDNIRAIEAGPLPQDLTDALRAIKIADPTMLDPSNWQR